MNNRHKLRTVSAIAAAMMAVTSVAPAVAPQLDIFSATVFAENTYKLTDDTKSYYTGDGTTAVQMTKTIDVTMDPNTTYTIKHVKIRQKATFTNQTVFDFSPATVLNNSIVKSIKFTRTGTIGHDSQYDYAYFDVTITTAENAAGSAKISYKAVSDATSIQGDLASDLDINLSIQRKSETTYLTVNENQTVRTLVPINYIGNGTVVSANESIATATVGSIDGSHRIVLITGHNKGNTTITFEGNDLGGQVPDSNVKHTFDVTVVGSSTNIEPTGITLNKTTATLNKVGDDIKLTCTITPSDATDKTVKWSVSDPSILDVDSQGTVTALKSGTAVVFAETSNGIKAKCTITVKDNTTVEETISVSPTTKTLSVGDTFSLPTTVSPANTTVTYSSDKEAIASVDSTGKITANAAGTAVITASTPSGKSATCTVTVKAQDSGTYTLHVGETQEIAVQASAPSGGTISYKANDPTIVGCSESNGKLALTGIKEGSTKVGIYVSTGSGTNGQHVGDISVEVLAKENTPVSSITVSVPESITEGETATAVAAVTPSDATKKDITWSSSDTNALVINATTGEMTAYKEADSVTITAAATDGSGIKGTATIKINKKSVPVTGIKFDNDSDITITEGGTATLAYTVEPSTADNKSVTFESSDPGVVSVNDKGEIKGKKTGSATITVKTVDGEKTATKKVTVTQDLEKVIDSLQQQINALQEQIEKLKADNAAKDAQIAELEKEKAALQNQLDNIKPADPELQNKVDELQQKLDDANDDIAALKQKLNDLQNEERVEYYVDPTTGTIVKRIRIFDPQTGEWITKPGSEETIGQTQPGYTIDPDGTVRDGNGDAVGQLRTSQDDENASAVDKLKKDLEELKQKQQELEDAIANDPSDENAKKLLEQTKNEIAALESKIDDLQKDLDDAKKNNYTIDKDTGAVKDGNGNIIGYTDPGYTIDNDGNVYDKDGKYIGKLRTADDDAANKAKEDAEKARKEAEDAAEQALKNKEQSEADKAAAEEAARKAQEAQSEAERKAQEAIEKAKQEEAARIAAEEAAKKVTYTIGSDGKIYSSTGLLVGTAKDRGYGPKTKWFCTDDGYFYSGPQEGKHGTYVSDLPEVSDKYTIKNGYVYSPDGDAVAAIAQRGYSPTNRWFCTDDGYFYSVPQTDKNGYYYDSDDGYTNGYTVSRGYIWYKGSPVGDVRTRGFNAISATWFSTTDGMFYSGPQTGHTGYYVTDPYNYNSAYYNGNYQFRNGAVYSRDGQLIGTAAARGYSPTNTWFCVDDGMFYPYPQTGKQGYYTNGQGYYNDYYSGNFRIQNGYIYDRYGNMIGTAAQRGYSNTNTWFCIDDGMFYAAPQNGKRGYYTNGYSVYNPYNGTVQSVPTNTTTQSVVTANTSKSETVKASVNGNVMTANMQNNHIIPASLLNHAKTNNLVINAVLSQNVRWTINPADISQAKSTDLGVISGTLKNVPAALRKTVKKNGVVGMAGISIGKNVQWGFKASLKLKVAAKFSGRTVTAYRYDTANSQLVQIGSSPVDAQGYINISGIDHGGDFVLVIS